MIETILATRLHRPQRLPRSVARPRLLARLDEGRHHRLTLVSAPAGFGKTTTVSAWAAECGLPVAWLSLDGGDGNPARFVMHVIAALRTVAPGIGEALLGVLQSPQPPPVESILTALLNELAALPEPLVLVLDDYHAVDSPATDQALGFLLEHLPPQLRLVITTREDPQLPLARMRARGQLTELRAADLRFGLDEAATFLTDVMGLRLDADEVAALEARTEGWIAGLQLAAISMRGQADTHAFVASFTGTHRFVLDYLIEEVLHQQPEPVQRFLLHTSLLERLCAPLCDAVVRDPATPGQETLEYLERGNLFVVPLDDERRWFRYHHLFAELLRQRLQLRAGEAGGDAGPAVPELHLRASRWFEDQGFEIEAFQHAAAGDDLARAERLAMGRGMPLYLRGGLTPVLAWLQSLPAPVVRASPALCVLFASALAVAGQLSRVEPLLLLAEDGLRDTDEDDEIRDLIGRIAGLRALVSLMAGDHASLPSIVSQSRRALAYLNPDNLHARSAATWRLGLALEQLGNRAEATTALRDAITLCEASGNTYINIMATTCLARVQQTCNELHRALETFERVLELMGEPPGPAACEAYLGLARIRYEWNELDVAEQHGRISVTLARQAEISNFVSSELFLANLQLTRGDLAGAQAALDAIEEEVREHRFAFRMPEVASVRIRALLQQGRLADAARLAREHDLALCLARVHLAGDDPAAALQVLARCHQQAEARGWPDLRLGTLVLEAIALDALGDRDGAQRSLEAALALAEPDGFIRTFVDEGAPLARLLAAARDRGVRPGYITRLLAAFDTRPAPGDAPAERAAPSGSPPLAEPLSRRELEVLRLIAQGLSNREIGERLFLALDTVKGHNRVIFGKLQVQRRTEAVARARELGLL